MSANFTPSLLEYDNRGKFLFWCQKVIPLVYDNSLSYYETLCKVVDYLNNVINNVDSAETNIQSIYDAYVLLQSYVNTYFDNLDVSTEIDRKLDEMAENGFFDNIVEELSAEQIANIPNVVTAWLNDNVTPTTPIVDATLSISGAAADAKATGMAISEVDNNREHAKRKLNDIWVYGRIQNNNGIRTLANGARRRTRYSCGVTDGIFKVDATNTDYSFYVLKYHYATSNSYDGVWDSENETWVKSATGGTAVKEFDFTEYPNNYFYLTLKRDDNEQISYFDDINVYFEISPVNDNIKKVDSYSVILGDIAQLKCGNPLNTYHFTNSVTPIDATTLSGYINTELTTSDTYGAISTAAARPTYYIRATNDCCFYVDTNRVNLGFRVSDEEPQTGTTGATKVWSGRACNYTMTYAPSKNAPWFVKAGQYIAFSVGAGWASGDEYVNLVLTEVAYELNDDEEMYENYINSTDAYEKFDALEEASQGRVRHVNVMNGMRCYIVDTSPKRAEYSFAIANEPYYPKPKVLILGTVHGNERANVPYLLNFIDRLLHDKEYANLAPIEWHIIPIVNVWGYNHSLIDSNTGNVIWYYTDQEYTVAENTSEIRGGVRENEHGVNINRDFKDNGGFLSDEATAVKNYWVANSAPYPFIATIDLHQYWTTTTAKLAGVVSLIPSDTRKLEQFKHGWYDITKGMRKAEIEMAEKVKNYGLDRQMIYLWGKWDNATTPREGTARGYFAGESGNTTNTNIAVPFSSTIESSMNMYFITQIRTPYREIPMKLGAIMTRNLVDAIANSAMKEFS